ncbi:MAG: tRNA pseudouridine(38-40) synthase TruA [Proteobacteria bacterium]|jgi:tRNA pseudouridine38-40 synthase|nr:tRNA pseudouridine(38-40) synthase TruA [Pseudomonadota bacterium]
MAVYRLTIEYDGEAFSGWQRQPGKRTVQGVIEEALAVIAREELRVQGASRTDAGVHALGQVASFETGLDLDPRKLADSVSALCRPHAAVVRAELAPPGFNARRDARGKWYRYRVLNRPAPSPLRLRTSWHVRDPLDLGAMRAAAAILVGTHDFRGFRAADCGREETVRTVTAIDVIERGDGVVELEVRGTAFLKNMVRIIAGTLVGVGLGRMSAESVARALETGDRTLAGQTAPACGLTLVEVFY